MVYSWGRIRRDEDRDRSKGILWKDSESYVKRFRVNFEDSGFFDSCERGSYVFREMFGKIFLLGIG